MTSKRRNPLITPAFANLRDKMLADIEASARSHIARANDSRDRIVSTPEWAKNHEARALENEGTVILLRMLYAAVRTASTTDALGSALEAYDTQWRQTVERSVAPRLPSKDSYVIRSLLDVLRSHIDDYVLAAQRRYGDTLRARTSPRRR